MASELVGGHDSKGSLFEGMVLFTASDLSQPPDPSAPLAPPPPPPPSHAQPLDEDLFSDLTLQNPQPQSPHPPLSARQVSRKKKRAVLIGYAPDNPPHPPLLPRPLPSSSEEPAELLPPSRLETNPHHASPASPDHSRGETDAKGSDTVPEGNKDRDKDLPADRASTKDGAFESIEEK